MCKSCDSGRNSDKPPTNRVARIGVVLFGVLALSAAFVGISKSGSQPVQGEIVVYKHPACDCCGRWIAHLEQEGLEVSKVNVNNPATIKSRYGVTGELASCHTAVVGGYVFEGHVPVDLIRKVLKEKPPIKGLSAPGMPIGSPGMEGPNPVNYEIFAFDESGNKTLFAKRQGRERP